MMGVLRASPEDVLAQLDACRPDERLDSIRTLGDPGAVLSELLDGTRVLLTKDLARARALTRMLLDVADELCEPLVQARARRLRAQALAYANEFPRALDLLGQSVELATAAKNRIEVARAKMASVHGLTRLGRYDDAVRAGEDARRIFHAEGETLLAAKAEVNVGEVHRHRSDAANALACFDRARATLGDDPIIRAQLDSNRAMALVDLNRFHEAEQSLESALAAFHAADMGRGAAIVEGNLAELMLKQGRIAKALHHYERARRSFEADCARGDLARLQAEQAEAFVLAGLLDDAAVAYDAALPELVAAGLVNEAARAAVGFGRTLIRLGRPDRVARVLHEAELTCKTLENSAALGHVCLARGELAAALGDMDRARHDLERALELLKERAADGAMVSNALALVHLARGSFEQAADVLQPALDHAKQHDLAPLVADLCHTRARIRMTQGDRNAALDDLREAVRQIERLRGSLQAERFRTAFAADRAVCYETLVSLLLDSHAVSRAEEAWAAVQLARSRSLLDIVSAGAPAAHSTAGTSDAPDRLVGAAIDARRELNVVYSRIDELQTLDPTEPVVARWHQQLQHAERRLRELENQLASTAGAAGMLTTPAKLSATQRLLPRRTCMIEYFLAANELIAFVVTRNTLHVVRRVARKDDLGTAIDQFFFQIDRASSYGEQAHTDRALLADIERCSETLSTLLIAPIRAEIAGADHLVIVPHGMLHGVPIHALRLDGEHLITRCDISYAPSASLLHHLERVPSHDRSEARTLILGVPDGDAPEIEAEAEAVAARLPGSTLLRGSLATAERLRREGQHAEIIHLACHGRFSATDPSSSGLKLADGWLTAREIAELRLNDAVVVLSGCATARSAVSAGDEQIGLIRSFFAAGARALVLSLWGVHDRATRELVTGIYDRWPAGAADTRALVAAVREASRAALREHPHPLLWAPLIVVGRP